MSEKEGKYNVVAILIGIPFLYFALLGPAVKYYETMPGFMQLLVESIYAPIEDLDELIPGNPIRKYLEYWIK